MTPDTISRSNRLPSGVGMNRGQTTPQMKTTSPTTADSTTPATGRFFETRIVIGYSSRSTHR